MLKTALLIFLSMSTSLFAAAPPTDSSIKPTSAGLDFNEVYSRSLSATQGVPLQETELAQSQEVLKQARGSFLPRITGYASYTRQEDTGALSGSGASNPDQRTVRLNATQALFRGLGEFAGYRAAGASVKQQEALTVSTRLNVLRGVGEVFFGVLAAEADRTDLVKLLDANNQRAAELGDRVRIGRSRQSELLQARSQVESAKAMVQAAESRVEQSRAAFEQGTGLAFDSALRDSVTLPAEIPALSEFLAHVEERPELRAAQAGVDVADESVAIARAGHLPSLDATANYYLERTGALAPVKWDVGVMLTLPIFAGGVVSSEVRAASQRERSAQLQQEQLRRSARTDVIAQHSKVQRALLQLAALESAQDSARRNFDSQSKDYRFGLVTNLEVTDSLNAYVQTQRALHATQFEAKTAWVALHAAIGKETL